MGGTFGEVTTRRVWEARGKCVTCGAWETTTGWASKGEAIYALTGGKLPYECDDCVYEEEELTAEIRRQTRRTP